MDKPRCQAILLMPNSRSWRKRWSPADLRCKFPAKEGNFCGVHKNLADAIESIVWKDDEDNS